MVLSEFSITARDASVAASALNCVQAATSLTKSLTKGRGQQRRVSQDEPLNFSSPGGSITST